MPMGLVTDDEFESQLSNVTKALPEKRERVITPELILEKLEPPGRKEGDNNVPDSLRSLIGVTGATEGRTSALELARVFGVSPSSASAYAHGSTSTSSYHKSDKTIIDVITKRKTRITKKALLKLQNSLDEISEEKLKLLDAKEAASVAKDMSAVVKNMEPPSNNTSEAGGVKFVIFTPEVRMENSYESITVNE